jgi:hypothetical protein
VRRSTRLVAGAGFRPAPDVLDAELLVAIRAAVAAQPIVPAISDGRPNWIREVTPDGAGRDGALARARPAGAARARVDDPIAWEYLTSNGSLTNRYRLADDGLNVKRSRFVCALLASLPDVTRGVATAL